MLAVPCTSCSNHIQRLSLVSTLHICLTSVDDLMNHRNAAGRNPPTKASPAFCTSPTRTESCRLNVNRSLFAENETLEASSGLLQDLPQCGTNLAATDATLMVQALIASEPAPDAVVTAASKAAAAAVITRFLEAGGLAALLQVQHTSIYQNRL